MTRAAWAERAINKLPMALGSDSVDAKAAIKLVEAEHKRAVRVVKAHIKLVTLDQHNYRAFEKSLILEVLNALLEDLAKGRR